MALGASNESTQQCAERVFMVRPAAFGYNAETADSNRFQHRSEDGAQAVQAAAAAEFDALAAVLGTEGVGVCAVADSAEPIKPDAIFPNNWVSFHSGGRATLYPMYAPNRRLERRRELLEQVSARFGNEIREIVDLTHHERDGQYLEGTGSLVLDRTHHIAYACRSPRTSERVLAEWCEIHGYEPVLFDAAGPDGLPLYHTNVLMSIGERYVLVGAEAIDADAREAVLGRLAESGREILQVDRGALANFAGNMLELATWDEALGDSRVLVMSARARQHLPAGIYAALTALTDSVLAVPVPTVEHVGGGSVRCMLAEVF